ncbi:LytR/AlgR family response regulator transcription factor [Winogradskyella sp.]|uniref:LytR/AlgR family response regulator transcription factor n=1 Tax=Winogradskyella sp. TaxID=1883156 RepID=UPI003BAA886F
MIKVVVIENEANALHYLTAQLRRHKDITILDTAGSIKVGKILIETANPNIVFLDIELDDGNAFELLDELKARTFEVIFTTGFDNYYQKAFQHFALSYLLKPIDPTELDKALSYYKNGLQRYGISKFNQFKNFIRNDDSKILLSIGYDHILVGLDTILYCKAHHNFTLFTLTSGKTEIVSNSLKYFTELFAEKGFFRANRSVLINVLHVKRIIKREALEMTNREIINVSLKNRQQLNHLIKKMS